MNKEGRRVSLWDKTRNLWFGCGRDGAVKHFNWWDMNPSWFSRFINHRVSLPEGTEFYLYSVFGPKRVVYRKSRARKLFFSGENLRYFYREYADYCLDEVHIALGFDEIDNDRYLRFPLWITRLFPPQCEEEDIRREIQQINAPRSPRERLFALIAGHDKWNTRAPIHDTISSRYPVDCAGRWRRNTKELQTRFGDDKKSFLRQYMFNICPENTNTPLYVTEKLFEAAQAGCIPVYYGADNRPEPEIVNPAAVVLWDPSAPGEAMETIERLIRDPAAAERMRAEPFFLPRSVEIVAEKFALLEGLVRRCL